MNSMALKLEYIRNENELHGIEAARVAVCTVITSRCCAQLHSPSLPAQPYSLCLTEPLPPSSPTIAALRSLVSTPQTAQPTTPSPQPNASPARLPPTSLTIPHFRSPITL